MASKRDAIVAAFVTALEVTIVGATTKPVGLNVHRMRTRRIEVDKLPAAVVYLGEETVDRDATLKSDRTFRVWVESRVKHPGQSGDEALDPLLVWAVKAMLDDFTHGAKLNDLREVRTVWDLDERAESLAAAAIEFEGIYQTLTTDPESV